MNNIELPATPSSSTTVRLQATWSIPRLRSHSPPVQRVGMHGAFKVFAVVARVVSHRPHPRLIFTPRRPPTSRKGERRASFSGASALHSSPRSAALLRSDSDQSNVKRPDGKGSQEVRLGQPPPTTLNCYKLGVIIVEAAIRVLLSVRYSDRHPAAAPTARTDLAQLESLHG